MTGRADRWPGTDGSTVRQPRPLSRSANQRSPGARRQNRPLQSLAYRDRPTRHRPAGSLPFTEFLHETDPVTDWESEPLSPVGSPAIASLRERIASDVLVVAGGSPTTWPPCSVLSSRIRPPGRRRGQHLFVVLGVAGLVGVDEREVELLAGWQCAQGFQARTDPQLDPVARPRLPATPRGRSRSTPG